MNIKKKHNVPLHVCKGCGSCYAAEKRLENLIKESVRYPERFKEGVYARPEVLKSLEKESFFKNENKSKI